MSAHGRWRGIVWAILAWLGVGSSTFVLAQADGNTKVAAVLAAQSAPVDTNSTDLAVFPWGEPRFTDGGVNVFPRPPWALAGWMDGGLWITNDTWYGWQPGLGDWSTDLATNRLLIHIDRALVSSNLWIAVAGAGEPNATLLAGFYDDDLLSVAEPVVLHVAAVTPWFTNSINLSRMPSTSVISLSATNGLMRIFNSVLYQDGSGLESSAPPVAPTIGTIPDAPITPTNGNYTASPTTHAPPLSVPRSSPLAQTGNHTWYVDRAAGDDLQHDGTAEVHVPSTSIGPKRTVAAALANAVHGDAVVVARGIYPERVHLDGIRMITHGRVVFQ